MTKLIHYRNKCIGCGICYEHQPELWRMSGKDGKATLLHSTAKKDVFVLQVSNLYKIKTQEVAGACPVKIIKIV
ncbi:MAG: ferredoxin [Sphingobacteriales bacterium]|nr:ferredoxin [Sphingobacteriales bacterium]